MSTEYGQSIQRSRRERYGGRYGSHWAYSQYRKLSSLSTVFLWPSLEAHWREGIVYQKSARFLKVTAWGTLLTEVLQS